MIPILIILLSFLSMEGFSWLLHKYVMHGILWNIHKTHHQHSNSFFEKNDVFTIFFGGIAVLLIIYGADAMDYRFWIGIGISLYGLAYFILHDILIHRRIKLFNLKSFGYLEAISRAHWKHHESKDKNAESFGLLVVSRKYFRRNNKRRL